MSLAIIACDSARKSVAPGSIVIGNCKYCLEPIQLSAERHRKWIAHPRAALICTRCASRGRKEGAK